MKHDISMRDLYAGVDSDANTSEFSKDGKTFTVLGTDYGNQRGCIDQFVTEIISSKELAFKVTRNGKKLPTVKALPLGRYLSRLRGFLYSDVPNVEHSEKVKAFFAATAQLDFQSEQWAGKPLAFNPFRQKFEAELLNELIELIRLNCQSKEFKYRSYSRVYNASRNSKSAELHINKWFEKCSRLLVMRLDFHYEDGYGKVISILEAQKHLKRLFNNARNNKLFAPLLTQIWRREYGELRGIHFHVVLLFDGHLAKKDEYIASRIGKYWETVITKGKGSHFNCNLDKRNRYKRLGIGMIDYFDAEKRENLLEAVRYLTKKEVLTGMADEGNFRAFGKGNTPKVKKDGPGRPRMYGPFDDITDLDDPGLIPE